MRKGFIFDYELCVGCKACSAACMLENKWTFKSRTVYSSNRECFRPDPVINLSMACNHCGDPVCLKGCPSGAYSSDSLTGAVIIDPNKCLGCRYCIWNCPYDAPKFIEDSGVIEKCNFCYHRLKEGAEPACSSSCPTGALGYGIIPETTNLEQFPWMPEKKINPSLIISGKKEYDGPVMVPSKDDSVFADLNNHSAKEGVEWSLVIFTFLTILSVAFSAAAPFMERPISGIAGISLVVFATLFSLFHLGSKTRAWRAIANFKTSPLSREISIFIVYACLVIINHFAEIPYYGIIISVVGLLLVMAIDSVYYFSVGKVTASFHSGQALLSALLIISFLLSALVPFVFIALVRIALTIRGIIIEKSDGKFVLRFIRLAFLIITGVVVLLGSETGSIVIFLIFFSGELADRILFYSDFRPLNIKDTLV